MLKKYTLIFVLLHLVGCAAVYKNPSDNNSSPVFGTFDNKEDFNAFLEKQGQLSLSPKQRSSTPYTGVLKVDGQAVSAHDIPTYLSSGEHNIVVLLMDMVKEAHVAFNVNIQSDRKYQIRHLPEEISDDQSEVTIWIEDYETGETLYSAKTTPLKTMVILQKSFIY